MSEQPVGEVADVRADERIDAAALAAYLRDRLDTGDAPLEIKQFPGGHSNLTYLLRFGDRELVLRRPPLGPVAPKAHDMAREFRVLSELWRVYPPAPRAYLFCDDASLIGASFYVMERRRGVVIRRRLPAELGDSAEARRRLSQALIDALADLHAVDYRAVGLADLGKPGGFVERQVRGWADRGVVCVAAGAASHFAAAGARPQRLQVRQRHVCRRRSRQDRRGVRLGDVHDRRSARRPRYAARLLGARRRPRGLPGGHDVADESRRVPAPRAVDRALRPAHRNRRLEDRLLPGFACYKTAVVAEQIYVRYVRGQTKDERFAMLGPVVPLLVEAACQIAKASRL